MNERSVCTLPHRVVITAKQTASNSAESRKKAMYLIEA